MISANVSLSVVILLTAYGNIELAVQAMKHGAYDFITKPFEVIELPARVRALIRRAPGGFGPRTAARAQPAAQSGPLRPGPQ